MYHILDQTRWSWKKCHAEVLPQVPLRATSTSELYLKFLIRFNPISPRLYEKRLAPGGGHMPPALNPWKMSTGPKIW